MAFKTLCFQMFEYKDQSTSNYGQSINSRQSVAN